MNSDRTRVDCRAGWLDGSQASQGGLGSRSTPRLTTCLKFRAWPRFSYACGSRRRDLILHEDLRIERRLARQHPIDGSSKLDRQQRVGPRLAVLLLDTLGKGLGLGRFSFEQRDRFGEGPLQMRVADLGSSRFVLFAGRRIRPFDQPRIRQEVADFPKAADVVDLVQHRHGQDASHSGNALQSKECVRVVDLGVLLEVQVELLNLFVVEVYQVDVDADHLLHTVSFKAFCDSAAVGLVADRLSKGGQVLLMVDELHVDDRGGSPPDEGGSAAKQVPCASHFLRIDVAGWEVASSQQHRQLLGVDPITLGLSAVDGFQIERVTEQERELLLVTKIGQSIPVECRFAPDDQILLDEGLRSDEELLGFLGIKVPVQMFVTAVIHDADVHRVGMRIDTAVEFVLCAVELHRVLPWASGLEPRTIEATPC